MSPLTIRMPEERIMGKLKAIFTIPELRQKIFITLLFLAIYRIGYSIPLPFVDQRQMNKNVGGGGAARQRPRLRVDVHRRQPEPGHHLRPRHHAVHLRVDHLPAARRRLPAAGKAAEGRRERPQEDQRIHPLRHRAHLLLPGVHVRAVHHEPGSGRRARLGACPSYNTWLLLADDGPDHDGRHHLPDVARRADRRVRHRQRHQPHHHGRHRRPHPGGDGVAVLRGRQVQLADASRSAAPAAGHQLREARAC